MQLAHAPTTLRWAHLAPGQRNGRLAGAPREQRQRERAARQGGRGLGAHAQAEAQLRGAQDVQRLRRQLQQRCCACVLGFWFRLTAEAQLRGAQDVQRLRRQLQQRLPRLCARV